MSGDDPKDAIGTPRIFVFLKDHYAGASAASYLLLSAWGLVWLFLKAPEDLPLAQLMTTGDVFKQGLLRGIPGFVMLAGGVATGIAALSFASELVAWAEKKGKKKIWRKALGVIAVLLSFLLLLGGAIAGVVWTARNQYSTMHRFTETPDPSSGPYLVTFDDDDEPERCLHLYLLLEKYGVFVDRHEVIAHLKKYPPERSVDDWVQLHRNWPFIIINADKISKLTRTQCD